MGSPGVSTSSIITASFRLSTDADARRESHVVIKTHMLHNTNDTPASHGLYDLRMGAIDHGNICIVCSHDKKQCSGHRGRIELKVPLVQPIAVAEIRRWLRVLCWECGEVIPEPSKYIGLPSAKRLTAAAAVSSENKTCRKCKAVHYKLIKDNEDHFTFWGAQPQEQVKNARKKKQQNNADNIKLYPGNILNIFNKVSMKNVRDLGKNADAHPRNLICSVVVVPPNNIRPATKSFNGTSSSQNECTTFLQNLIRKNDSLPNILPESMSTGKPGKKVDTGEIDETIQLMQQIMYDLIIGSAAARTPQTVSGKRSILVGTKPVKSFLRSLPRKKGRIRANLLGGRVFHICRDTISGNVTYKNNEVGMPIQFAKIMQVEEVVQPFNMQRLMEFYMNGRKNYPGCTRIKKKTTGNVHDVGSIKNMSLEVGDILYRDIVDGDIVILNRQPTLERSSVTALHVKIIKKISERTIQFNPNICNLFNADFDGDQMLLIAIRGHSARAEALTLMTLENLFISTKSCSPAIGEIQDAVIGSYEFTRDHVRLDKYHAMSMFSFPSNSDPDFRKYSSDHIFTGKDIASILLERTPINYNDSPGSFNENFAPFVNYNPNETRTVIRNGIMESGVLDSKSVGAVAGSIFHSISRKYGVKSALDAIYNLQHVALNFLMLSGCTISTSNIIINKTALEQLHDIVTTTKMEARIVTEKLISGNIIAPIDKTISEHYEELQRESLKTDTNAVLGVVLQNIKPFSNGLFKMIASGSKGKINNLIHICGVIGQIELGGARMQPTFSFGRTSPYFARFDTSPESRGYVNNNYINGTVSYEFWFSGCNGRYDLINKALSTATTGYFMRKGVMSVQSCMVNNRRQLTKGSNIVQFLYGHDGFDSRSLEKIKMRSIYLSNEEIKTNVWMENSTLQAKIDAAFEKIIEDRDQLREIFMRRERDNVAKIFKDEFLLPVDVRSIVNDVLFKYESDDKITDKVLDSNMNIVSDLCLNLKYSYMNERCERNKVKTPEIFEAATTLTCALIRYEMSCKVLSRLTNEQTIYIAELIKYKYKDALCDYGTAAGFHAAQAIFEPLTQYMLDSHHRSVSGGTSKSGLTRVQEVFGAKPLSAEQSAEMLLPIKESVFEGVADKDTLARRLASIIEPITIKTMVRSYAVIVESYDELVYPEFISDKEWIDDFARANPLTRAPSNLMNWCFRLVINKATMVLKSVDLLSIVSALRRFPGIYVVHTHESAAEIVIRLWLKSQYAKKEGGEFNYKPILTSIMETDIRGIPGVTKAFFKKAKRHYLGKDGALESKEIYTIATDGTNLYSASMVSFIDSENIISNSINDTLEMFGLEAARAKIISECRGFMDSETPNLRHVYIYADEMTRTGRYTSIERGGLKARERNNVLLQMAYGAPIQVVTEAAINASKTRVYGTAGPQLMGDVPRIGSIYNDLRIDEEFVSKNLKSAATILDEL